MKAVIQRVLKASCIINEKEYSRIDKGLLIYLGVEESDDFQVALKLVNKILKLRIFEDELGKTNLSIKNFTNYEILLVSQFTLCANLNEGNRPSFKGAKNPKDAKLIYEFVLNKLNNEIKTKSGVFQENMKITSVNDGPFTLVVEMK